MESDYEQAERERDRSERRAALLDSIVASKPVPLAPGVWHVVVHRSGRGVAMPYVSARISYDSLKYGEWYWGHYFNTLEEAMAHFNARQE